MIRYKNILTLDMIIIIVIIPLCKRSKKLLEALECQSGPSKDGAFSFLQ